MHITLKGANINLFKKSKVALFIRQSSLQVILHVHGVPVKRQDSKGKN
jgi:hypothetical protein